MDYTLTKLDLHAHTVHVCARLEKPAQRQRLSLPVWIPGSYLVREFARHVHALAANQNGNPCSAKQVDKCTWEIECDSDAALEIHYRVYAFDSSVRTAFLNTERGFLNGTSLFIYDKERRHEPHTLTIDSSIAPADWSLITALPAVQIDTQGFGRYEAKNYDTLVDNPIALGHFWQVTWQERGVPHRLAVSGALPQFDGERLLRDTQTIVRTAMELWHPDGASPAHTHYVFLLHASDTGYGGLEHENSTALLCSRKDLPQQGIATAPSGYNDVLGLICHEYFHTWLVKRLKPQNFLQYDYQTENYTELLWLFEGFTSYYDHALIARAGLITQEAYLKHLSTLINRVLRSPALEHHSVTAASFDAWIKFYRPDENIANATLNYYAHGAFIAWALDSALQKQSNNQHNLDGLLRLLWSRYLSTGLTEDAVLKTLAEFANPDLAQDLKRWIHGEALPPWEQLLAGQPITVECVSGSLEERLGCQFETHGSQLQVKSVARASAAEAAGLCAGDECLAVDGWRMHKLADLVTYASQAQCTITIARDGQLMELALTVPHEATSWKLTSLSSE